MREAGMTFLEVLIGLILVVVIMALVFTFFVRSGKVYKSETGGLDMQQAARVAVDDIGRHLQQVGYGIARENPYNPASWQKALIYGSGHAVAFNADIDPTIGPIDTSSSVTFMGLHSYAGEGGSGTDEGAETYVFSIDANGDGRPLANDHYEAEEGSYNPAAMTENPLDFAVFLRVYGYSDRLTKEITPITPYLFTNGTRAYV